MGLSDSLDSAKRVSKPAQSNEYANIQYHGSVPSEVGVSLREVPEDEAQWRAEIRRVTGMDMPSDKKVELSQVRYWGDPNDPLVYCRFVLTEPDTGHRVDLEDIITATKAVRTVEDRPILTDALVVSVADLQVGKVGSRGGTEELVARVEDRIQKLESLIREQCPAEVYLFDTGDCVEGFENVDSQYFTNDLSFPEQLRVGRRIFTELVTRIAPLTPCMVVSSVPSNHGRWRKGKGALGKPHDDFGLENLTAVADACTLNLALNHVEFYVPEPWEESVAFDISDTSVGLAHGHQVNRPNSLPQWWANQSHGGQPVADCDILLTGHFHHLRVEEVGHNGRTGQSRFWLQSPSLDNGSDWFRLQKGADSKPGLLTFTINGDSWSDLRVL